VEKSTCQATIICPHQRQLEFPLPDCEIVAGFAGGSEAGDNFAGAFGSVLFDPPAFRGNRRAICKSLFHQVLRLAIRTVIINDRMGTAIRKLLSFKALC